MDDAEFILTEIIHRSRCSHVLDFSFHGAHFPQRTTHTLHTDGLSATLLMHLLVHGPRPGHHRLVLSNRWGWLWLRAAVYGHAGDARRLVAAARRRATAAGLGILGPREARARHLHAEAVRPGRRRRARRATRLELRPLLSLRLAGRGRGRTRDKHVGVSQCEAVPLEPPRDVARRLVA